MSREQTPTPSQPAVDLARAVLEHDSWSPSVVRMLAEEVIRSAQRTGEPLGGAMAKKAVLELTPLEARCVLRMCGNIMEYPDVRDSMFDNKRELKAAMSAYEKLGGTNYELSK